MLTRLEHPIAADRVAQLRDAATDTPQFRALLEDVSMFLAIEATRELPTQTTSITTPVAPCVGKRLSGHQIIAPIMRAGLGLLNGFQRMLPNATIAHLGFFRDPQTLQAVPYYANLPMVLEDRHIFVLDPMLATGHSAGAAIALLQQHGATKVTFVSLVATQSGISRLQNQFPHVDIITAAIDEHLNDHGYIVPGLGDAGDRLFGTDHSVPISR